MRRSALYILSALCVAFAGPTWADDKVDVSAANQAFDNAVSKRDISAVEALWAHDAAVTIIHPSSKEPLVGWDAVRKSWAEGTLARFSEIQLSQPNPHVHISGNTATVVGVEKFQSKRADNGQTVEFQALTTNIFEKRDGRWLMTHHHASRMPQ
jgi:ketosteroid isomerase-like protein